MTHAVPAIIVPDATPGLAPGVYTNQQLTEAQAEQLAGRARLWQYRHDISISLDLRIPNISHLPLFIGVDERQWAKLLLAVISEHAYSVDL